MFVQVNYHEFTQLIQTWNREYIQQLYRKKAASRSSITALEFADIMKTGCSHRLNPYIVQNMMDAVEQGGRRQVSKFFIMMCIKLGEPSSINLNEESFVLVLYFL